MTANVAPNTPSVENDINGLKEKVEEMSLELRYVVTLLQSSQGAFSTKNELFDLLRDETREKALTRLDAGMAKRCDMRKECREKFAGFLDDNLELLDRPKVSEEELRSRTEVLDSLKEKSVPGRCDGCFNEVGTIFKQQMQLMRSLKLYQSQEDIRSSIDVLPETEVVKDLLEPLSNVQRLIILKSLLKAPRSFSELSTLTNLRGGNLLFHLQRLTASELVSQRGGRGEYTLSEKGMRALEMVNDLYQRISAPTITSRAD